MTSAESAVALLHLSAVVSVLTVAYVGLDRTPHGGDPMGDAFKVVRQRAEQLVQQLGVSETVGASLFSSAKWRGVTTIYPTCIMCIVAEVPVHLGRVHTPIFLIYRQFRIPFLKYFRGRIHFWAVGLMALISTVLFLSICGMIVWHNEFVEDVAFQRTAFVALTGFTAWVLITGLIALALRPARLTRLCDSLHETILKRLEKKLSDAERTVAAFKPGAASNPSTGG